MNLHDWLQQDHGTNRTNICRTIAEMDESRPVRPAIARARQMPNMHDVSSVELLAALSAWLDTLTDDERAQLALDCWGER